MREATMADDDLTDAPAWEFGFLITGPCDDEDGEQLFWSNDDGWVSRDCATTFFPHETHIDDPLNQLDESGVWRISATEAEAIAEREKQERKREADDAYDEALNDATHAAYEKFAAVLCLPDGDQGSDLLCQLNDAIHSVMADWR